MNLQQRDKAVIWHPFTHFKYAPDPIPIVRGEAVYLIDENNNRYIDGISSWWVNIHGHAHPYIAEKLYEQATTLEQVIFAGFTHRPAIELAERILPLLPGSFSKLFYSDNGSTAVEVAIKMALQYWWNKESPRKKIIAFNNSYHGDTFGSMSISDRGIFTKAFHDHLFEVIFIDTPTKENINEVLQTVSANADAAAFIYEPLIQGAGGMKIYEAGLLDQIIKNCKDNNIICIADEVMTGFYRTGKFFAGEYLNEKADIICLSKGLTGGTMALGVTAASSKIVDAFVSDDKTKTFFHGHSFTANPLACAASLASLDLLQRPEAIANIELICQLHKTVIAELQNSKHAKAVRNLGTIIAFEIEQGKDGYLNNVSTLVTEKVMKEGVYLRPLGNTVYIMPPYCVTKEQLQQVYNSILHTLEAL